MTFEEQNKLVLDRNRRVQRVADFGAQAISELRKAIASSEFNQCFIELKDGSSKGTMKVCYHGYEILFCVEIEAKAQSPMHSDSAEHLVFPYLKISARLSAYHLSYEGSPNDKPKGHLLAKLEIRSTQEPCEDFFWDEEYELHRRQLNEFAQPFLVRVFRTAFDNGMMLRP